MPKLQVRNSSVEKSVQFSARYRTHLHFSIRLEIIKIPGGTRLSQRQPHRENKWKWQFSKYSINDDVKISHHVIVSGTYEQQVNYQDYFTVGLNYLRYRYKLSNSNSVLETLSTGICYWLICNGLVQLNCFFVYFAKHLYILNHKIVELYCRNHKIDFF